MNHDVSERMSKAAHPDLALWMGRLARHAEYGGEYSGNRLPEGAIPGFLHSDPPQMLAFLTEAAACHGRTGDQPLHEWFLNRRHRAVLSTEAREWLQQCPDPEAVREMLDDGFVKSFGNFGRDTLEELRQAMAERAGDNPLLDCLPRHYAVTEKHYQASPVNWKILGDDLTELFRQYAQRDFAHHREVSAWWHALHPINGDDSPVRQWARDPANREPLARLVQELGGDGHSVYRPNAKMFADLPEAAKERHLRPHPGCGSDEPGIYGLELLRDLAAAFNIHQDKIGRGSAMRELNQRLTRLLGHLRETPEATVAAA